MSRMQERHSKIIDVLAKNGHVRTAELAKLLATSRETIRRDLNILAEQGLLIKSHGGAVLPEKDTPAFVPIKEREKTNFLEKQALCAYAAKAVKEFDTIFLDTSTTVLPLQHFIPRNYRLTFISNSIRLIAELAHLQNPNWTVVALGGIVDYEIFSSSRYLAMNNLQHFKPNKAFLSCRGIDSDLTVCDTKLDDVEIKSYVVANCPETYLLADHSKLGAPGMVKAADAAAFHRIVVTEEADPLFLSRLTAHGCQVQIAPPLKR